MNKQNWWTGWLPYPNSWFMAIKLAIPAYIGATVIIAFEFWRLSFVGVLLVLNGINGAILLFGFSFIVLLLALIWFLILMVIYRLLLKLLWSNPPKWLSLPSWKYLVIRDFVILVVSILPIVILFAIYILFMSSIKQNFTDLRTPKLTYDFFLLKFSWLWFISAAYLYQVYTKFSKHDLSAAVNNLK